MKRKENPLFKGWTDQALLDEIKKLHLKLEEIQPEISKAVVRVKRAKEALEATKEHKEWVEAQEARKALGSYRSLDTNAHLMRMEARARRLAVPHKPDYKVED